MYFINYTSTGYASCQVLSEPTGLQIYSTVSQDPSAGISMYSISIVSHFALASNHCTSCSKQVEPEQTVNSICQMISILFPLYGAGTKIRTRDLLITNQLLYQLSYASVIYLYSIMAESEGFEPSIQLPV